MDFMLLPSLESLRLAYLIKRFMPKLPHVWYELASYILRCCSTKSGKKNHI